MWRKISLLNLIIFMETKQENIRKTSCLLTKFNVIFQKKNEKKSRRVAAKIVCFMFSLLAISYREPNQHAHEHNPIPTTDWCEESVFEVCNLYLSSSNSVLFRFFYLNYQADKIEYQNEMLQKIRLQQKWEKNPPKIIKSAISATISLCVSETGAVRFPIVFY